MKMGDKRPATKTELPPKASNNNAAQPSDTNVLRGPLGAMPAAGGAPTAASAPVAPAAGSGSAPLLNSPETGVPSPAVRISPVPFTAAKVAMVTTFITSMQQRLQAAEDEVRKSREALQAARQEATSLKTALKEAQDTLWAQGIPRFFLVNFLDCSYIVPGASRNISYPRKI
jgi:hypothetical protein